ncbi:hypothetical protein A2763_02710 [Candidatus Kaiserbacteria bacterium RIFCSPHIGHO2_01_FULL_54_36]|uniref:DNA polymerase III delta N-terminal domain-containing protein n=1 Tax=Candidatus Kaiserbacteria bacterium RIFCSPHIGHO2_01_FULL_54_36 TaxID=1798482 RepID=A0A1F6CP46_9BACT|nr:MAG: hypothetical protein A2763_02710 [Candidatus Kaiserbacteria bacterium RIFCSPHIGHO2_01_FULL_54_36]OGG75230.1 MAG: hypothetical protein A3A41_03850 [Candidatus Kaiserbacteria bacterium RIFCSPLOWO2_01_FULL_54_22]
MLHFYFGTDRKKARTEMNAAIERMDKKALLVRISDANLPEDLAAALSGGGLFSEKRAVVLDGVLANDEMRERMLEALSSMRDSEERFFILEEKPDAATRKQIEKYAGKSYRFDSASAKKDGSIFGLANALRRGDRKGLWVAYQRELASKSAPEAIHGVLFWAAKDMFIKPAAGIARVRAKKLIETLAELPHEARRRGEEMEYALERFVLSMV